MKEGKVAIAVALGFFLVLTVGIVMASVMADGCHCYEACYYCDPDTGCKIYDGPGACLCNPDPCRLSEHWICCVQPKN
jgi:hypothetical protein